MVLLCWVCVLGLGFCFGLGFGVCLLGFCVLWLGWGWFGFGDRLLGLGLGFCLWFCDLCLMFWFVFWVLGNAVVWGLDLLIC